MKLHIFNPEHDLALAADSPFWTAPHAGRQLRADLGWLPALWAGDGDIVVTDDAEKASAEASRQRLANNNVRYVSLGELSGLHSLYDDITDIESWGWDKSVKAQLQRRGVPSRLLPDEERLGRMRALSDRATSARMLHDMREACALTAGEAYVVDSVDDFRALASSLQRAVVKTPWSSSGRGVKYIDRADEKTVSWASNAIKKHGHIMVERYLERIKDFGVEFTAHADGTVSCDGLSLFHTRNGAYVGNVLATEAEKRGMLAGYVALDVLDEYISFICSWMSKEIAGGYTGPFGVDMMVVKTDEGVRVDPCVEINLRRTMGHVALAVSPSEAGLQSVMRIAYEGGQYHFRIRNDHELLY